MADHDHSARDVGAASERHDHDVLDVMRAAREDHTHTARDLGGVPTLKQVQDLERRLETLEARYQAEAEVPAVVADGGNTVARIVHAMREHARALADFDHHREFAQELSALADAIERGEA